ncbi:FAD-binding oxidoreductase [Streptomyces pathocidini]
MQAAAALPAASAPAPPPRGWSALAAGLDGWLIRPADAGYDSARRLYNTRFDPLRPAAIAYVTGPGDIAECLAFARRHATPVAVRNGGHSYGGWSSGNGRLVIDVSPLDQIATAPDRPAPDGPGTVRPAPDRSGTGRPTPSRPGTLHSDTLHAGPLRPGPAGEATVGAGTKLATVYAALGAQGVTLPGGTCPSVGVSGLTLGGGHGVVSRAYGLTCDSLLSATLVTADGRTLHCDPREHPALFWALRGAGHGIFGVVTELRFRTHPAPAAASARLAWPWTGAAAVLRAWQEWGPDLPDEIWSAAHLEAGSGSPPRVRVTVFSLGAYGELENAVDRLVGRVGARPSAVSLHRHSYGEAMTGYARCAARPAEECRLPGTTPGRHPSGAVRRETYAARSDFYDRPIADRGLTALVAGVERFPGASGTHGTRGMGGIDGSVTVHLTALGGAINRIAPTATAFVHRRSRVLAQYMVNWPAGHGPSAPTAWLNGLYRAMRPYASGAAYQNYADPALEDWRRAYYGPAADRLARVKHRYDPDRVFDHPQAV